MVVVKKMDMDNCNCDFSSSDKLKCRLRNVDTCIMDYETKATLEHELCQRLSGRNPVDFHHRKNSNSHFRVNSFQCRFSEAPIQQTSLPDVVLSCSEDQTPPKLSPETCGRVLGHIADHFEMDRRKRMTVNKNRFFQKNGTIPIEEKKVLFEHSFCKRSEISRKNIQNTEQTHNLQNAEASHAIQETKSTLRIEITLKSLLQRVLEEILLCK